MNGGGLTIAQLAARTGVSPGTLRAWERRHGFPAPARTPGGERRYDEADAERVARVVRDRDAGMSLALAIARLADRPVAGDVTLFGALRARRPDLDVHVLSKRTLAALSHAIEDECCAQSQSGLLYGAFQRERFYRSAEPRWRELGRTADVAVVLADFPALARPPGAPVEVPVGTSSPLRREWAVVCDAPGYAACLVGWEPPRPDPTSDPERPFEMVWSVEPSVVRHAAQVCNACVEPVAPDVARAAERRLDAPPSGIGPEQMRLASALTGRMAAYLDA